MVVLDTAESAAAMLEQTESMRAVAFYLFSDSCATALTDSVGEGFWVGRICMSTTSPHCSKDPTTTIAVKLVAGGGWCKGGSPLTKTALVLPAWDTVRSCK